MQPYISEAIQFIAKNTGTDFDDVKLLGVNHTVSSPKGYEVKLSPTGIYSCKKGNKTIYISAPADRPASLKEIPESDAMKWVEESRDAVSSSLDPDFNPELMRFWLSTDYARSNDIELKNIFTTYVYRMGKSGSFDGLDYKKGDVIIYSNVSHIRPPNLEDVSHFKPTSYGIPKEAKVMRFGKWVDF